MFGDTGFEDYLPVAAGQTNAQIGNSTLGNSPNTRETGVIKSITIIPTTLSPGAVTIKDGSGGSAIPIFSGGASSLTTLTPFTLFFQGLRAQTGPWFITTGAGLSVIVNGRII